MKIDVNEEFVQNAHLEAAAFGLENGADENFNRMAQRYVDGHWRKFISKLELFSDPFAGKVFVDYGCKFGHLTPLLVDQGVKKIYAIDVNDSYIANGRAVFGRKYPVEYVKSVNCFVDIQSNTADFILTNEVISHINPMYLDTYYAEVARILKPGGELIISDGNNWMNLKTRSDLIDWYSLWESGTSKEFGDRNYESLRRGYFSANHPNLSAKDNEYLAKNTSGLWGDQLDGAVKSFLSGTFTERPHRPGVYPTHPTYGVVMERAFDPAQIVRALETYGLDGKQVLRGKDQNDLSKAGETKNFTIRARKIPESQEAWKDHAEKTLSPAKSEVVQTRATVPPLNNIHAQIAASPAKSEVVQTRATVPPLNNIHAQIAAAESELIGKASALLAIANRANRGSSLKRGIRKLRILLLGDKALKADVSHTLETLLSHQIAADQEGRKEIAAKLKAMSKSLKRHL